MERITVGQVAAIADVARLLPVAVIATDVAGRVTEWSPHAELLYGWPRAEVMGRDIRELTVGPSEAGIAEAILARLVAGETWQGEFTAARADGSEIDVHVIDIPLAAPDGSIGGILGLSVDVSTARSALTHAVETMRDAIVVGGQLRDRDRVRLVADLDDRVATPLSRIAAALTASGADPALAEMANEALRAVREVGGALHHATLDPAEAARLATDLVTAAARRAGADLRIAEPGIPRLAPWQAGRLVRTAEAVLSAILRVRPTEALDAAVTAEHGAILLRIAPAAVPDPGRRIPASTRAAPPAPVLIVAEAGPGAALTGAIGSGSGLTLAGTVRTVGEALHQADRHPRVVVVHLPVAGGPGPAELARLTGALPAAAIVVVSPAMGAEALARLIAAGIRGHCVDDAPTEATAAAIRAVAEGAWAFLRTGVTGDASAGIPPLSPREEQILRLLLSGARVSRIAADLGIDVRTVSTYKRRIQTKLGVTSTAALVVRALELGITEPDA